LFIALTLSLFPSIHWSKNIHIISSWISYVHGISKNSKIIVIQIIHAIIWMNLAALIMARNLHFQGCERNHNIVVFCIQIMKIGMKERPKNLFRRTP
jgi:hypothetical protein